MPHPDGLALLLASGSFVGSLFFLHYRRVAAARRVEADRVEDERLMAWMEELRAAGAAQSVDPGVGTVLGRYAQVHGTGRHHASHLRPATMARGLDAPAIIG